MSWFYWINRRHSTGALYTFQDIVNRYNEENKSAWKTSQYGFVLFNHMSFQVKTLDNQCGVMLLHGISTFSNIMPIVSWLAIEGEYTKIMCSLSDSDMIKEAQVYGFKIIDTFNNKRTRNDVSLLIKDV